LQDSAILRFITWATMHVDCKMLIVDTDIWGFVRVLFSNFKLEKYPTPLHNRTTSPYYDHTEKKTPAVWPSGQNGRVSRRQENSDCSSPEWVEKASWATVHLLDGHSEERPSSAQP